MSDVPVGVSRGAAWEGIASLPVRSLRRVLRDRV